MLKVNYLYEEQLGYFDQYKVNAFIWVVIDLLIFFTSENTLFFKFNDVQPILKVSKVVNK
jgi:hypothetical protein